MPELWVRHVASSAAVVRTSVQETLEDAGVGREEVSDVLLVASELISNAIRHAPALQCGQIPVTWSAQPDGCMISVTDGGCTPLLSTQTPAETDVRGRGLAIVATIANEWGSESSKNSTKVWAFYRFNRLVSPAQRASA